VAKLRAVNTERYDGSSFYARELQACSVEAREEITVCDEPISAVEHWLSQTGSPQDCCWLSKWHDTRVQYWPNEGQPRRSKGKEEAIVAVNKVAVPIDNISSLVLTLLYEPSVAVTKNKIV
jgi:hypothetical protein